MFVEHKKIVKIKKSTFVENIFNFQGKPVSFKDYQISKAILDNEAHTLLLIGGRQISKSFTVGFDILSRCALKPHYYILYVAPTLDQTRTFSNEKIRARIMESPKFKKYYIDSESIQNVFEKDFLNGSHVYFKAATQKDTIRGISVDEVRFDEIQDISSDVIPIVEETITGKKNPYRSYSGTAKTVTNYINYLWQKSNQISPILICPDCKKHNLPYLDNIDKRGLICKYCKGLLSVRDPYIYLSAIGNKDSYITGFWVPQIVLPLHAENPNKWSEVYRKFTEYPEEQFLNEVMGISAGQGVVMLSEEDLKKMCTPEFKKWDSIPPSFLGNRKTIMYASIDWGITNNEHKSYTVLVFGAFNPRTNRFTIVNIIKFTETDHLAIINEIASLCRDFMVGKVVADWGVGHVANQLLQQKLGMPVYPVMYTGERKLIEYDHKEKYYKVSKTRSLLDLIRQIKRGLIHCYSWSQFYEFKNHFLGQFAEIKKDRFGNESIRFDHPADQPDDALQAVNMMYAVFKRDFDRKGTYFA